MDEFEALRALRSTRVAPDNEAVSKARDALERAIDEESQGDVAVGTRFSGIQPGWRWTLAGAGVAALVGIVIALTGDATQDQSVRPSLGAVAAELQSYVGGDFEHLDDLGLTLADVASESEVVGTGQIVDIREGYKEGGALHMFLVVEPDRLAAGAPLLGRSNEVLVDRIAPPLNHATGNRGIGELRAAAVAAPERVAFMLTPTPPSIYENASDKFAGRDEDDPIFQPTHPSSLLALDEKAGVAFPLTTEEQLENAAGNVDFLTKLGAKIDRFSARSGALVGGG